MKIFHFFGFLFAVLFGAFMMSGCGPTGVDDTNTTVVVDVNETNTTMVVCPTRAYQPTQKELVMVEAATVFLVENDEISVVAAELEDAEDGYFLTFSRLLPWEVNQLIDQHPTAVRLLVEVFGGSVLKHQDFETLERLKNLVSWAQSKVELANEEPFVSAVENYLLAEVSQFANGNRVELAENIRQESGLSVEDALAVYKNFNRKIDRENCAWIETLELIQDKIASAMDEYQGPEPLEIPKLKAGCYSNLGFNHSLVKSDFTEDLIIGDQGEEVQRLQVALQPYGSRVPSDGVFGVELQNALLNFQKAYGLEETGELDEASKTELNKKNGSNAVEFCVEPAEDMIVMDGEQVDLFKITINSQSDGESLNWMRIQFTGTAPVSSVEEVFVLDENHNILSMDEVDFETNWFYLGLPLEKGENTFYVAAEYDTDQSNDGLTVSVKILNVEFLNSYFQVSEDGATHTLKY